MHKGGLRHLHLLSGHYLDQSVCLIDLNLINSPLVKYEKVFLGECTTTEFEADHLDLEVPLEDGFTIVTIETRSAFKKRRG